MQRFIYSFTLLVALLLASCANPGAIVPVAPPVPVPVGVVQVTPAPSQPVGLAQAVLVMNCPAYSQCSLRPVDPLTGQDIPNYPPFSWGQYTSYTFAPDRRTLAVTVQDGESWSASLHLVDLATWRDTTTEVKVSGFTLNNIMAFSPDGSRLALTVETQTDRSRLAVVELASRQITAQAELDFVPWRLAFSADGAGLVAYGSTYSPDDHTPQVTLLNAADLSPLWRQSLAQVRDGEYPLPNSPETAPEFQHIRPALVFSPDRRYLYLVHADEDKLTRIDFVERTVTTSAVHLAGRWFDSLLALTADVAQAKAAHGQAKQAVLSPDGSRLYVIGSSYRPVEEDDGQSEIVETGLGLLQVVDPQTGQVLSQVETEATMLEGSADGTRLYLSGWRGSGPGQQLWQSVLDTATLAEVAALDGWQLWPTRRLDGQPLLLGYNFERTDRIETAAFDPQTFEHGAVFEGVALGERE
jgi:DNA-binding beta-propeller fold protein YncE